MALPTFNTKSPTVKRILKEASELSQNPDPTLHAAPLESDIFEWHFTLAGPPSTPYSTGIYHGRITLPPTYPLKPPNFRFLTPSARFEVNREICLSISGHHEETWQPAWGIRTALWALRAFMEGDAKGQVGGMEMGVGERRRLAGESRSWRCRGCGGRSNEGILKEEGGGGDGTEKEEKVPEELRFGFRDEMGKQGEGKVDEQSNKTSTEPRGSTSVGTSTPDSVAPPALPATITQPPPASATAQIQAQIRPIPTRQGPADGVPAWIDKAITGLVAALGLMIIKKILI